MLIETVRRYKCDGCGQEAITPYNWRSFAIIFTGRCAAYYERAATKNYCEPCAMKMRQAVKGDKNGLDAQKAP
jgi:hypothetical protein